VVSRERLRDVVDDARYEPGFRDAEQIAHHVELLGRRDERGQRRNDRPRQDDAREPALRADPLQDHVARHLEHDVAQRERTCAEAEHRVAETQIDHHLQFREADVDAVDVGGHVREHEDRQDAQRKMPRNARFPRRVVRVAAVDRMIGRARRVQIQEVPPLLGENGCVNLSMAMPPVVDVECQQQFRCPRHDAQPRVRVVVAWATKHSRVLDASGRTATSPAIRQRARSGASVSAKACFLGVRNGARADDVPIDGSDGAPFELARGFYRIVSARAR
jgi:hypothetical protein